MFDQNDLLGPDDAAAYTHVSKSVLAQLRYTGGGAPYLNPTPRTILYLRSDLDEWLKSSRRVSTVGR